MPLDTISGFYGGRLDAVLTRFVDAWLAFPGILFYLIATTTIHAYRLSLFWNTVGLIIALSTRAWRTGRAAGGQRRPGQGQSAPLPLHYLVAYILQTRHARGTAVFVAPPWRVTLGRQ